MANELELLEEQQRLLEEEQQLLIQQQAEEVDAVATSRVKSLGDVLAGATEIGPAPGLFERFKAKMIRGIPGVSQFAGGIGGGAVTLAATANPFVVAGGAAAGGLVGRTGGRLMQLGINQFMDNPLESIARTIREPYVSGIIKQMTPDQKRKFGKEIQTTAFIEASTAPIGLAAGWMFKAFGKNFLKEVLSRELAERGTEKGFQKILRIPTEKVPVGVIRKVGDWINKLLKVTGRGVEEAVEKKSKTFVPTYKIKEGVRSILPKGISIDDFEASGAQKKLVKRATDLVMDLPREASIPQLWEARKGVDRIFYNYSFKKEAANYLSKLRQLTNAPIKEASGEIATAFGRYSNVRNAQTTIGNKFNAIEVEGLPFGVKVEKFSKALFSGNEDEMVGFLKAVDDFLPAEDRVIEDLLDIGAAEKIDSPVPGSIFWRATVGALGGKRGIARIADVIGSKPSKIIQRGVGRLIPTVISEEESDF